MGIFDKIFKRNISNNNNNNDFQLFATADDNLTRVTNEEVMEIPTIKACVDTVANLLSTLDFVMVDENGVEIEDYRLKILNCDNGTQMSATDFKRALYRDSLIYGDSHAYIQRRGSKVTGLIYIPHGKIQINDYNNINPIEQQDITISVMGKQYDYFDFVNICFGETKNGVRGVGIADRLYNALGANKAMLEHINKNTTNGYMKRGIIETENRIDKSIATKVREAWRKLWNDNSNTLMILSNGLKYRELQASAQESQLADIKKMSDEEIAKALGVPMSILNSTAQDSQYRNWINLKINPLVSIIEDGFNKNLLLCEEYEKKQLRLNTEKLIRTDTKAMMEAKVMAIKNGIINRNEARKELGYQPINNLDSMVLGLGDVLLTTDGKLVIPNMGVVLDAKTGMILSSKDKNNIEENQDIEG